MPKSALRKKSFGSVIRHLLRCETEEDCLRIQKGRMLVKRLGKWSILFSIGITLYISDLIAAILNHLQAVETVTTSFLYRWTVGLFVPAPQPNLSVIAMWKIIDLVQMFIFLSIVIISIRWAYADCRVSKAKIITFPRLMFTAFVSNFVIYFALKNFTQI